MSGVAPPPLGLLRSTVQPGVSGHGHSRCVSQRLRRKHYPSTGVWRCGAASRSKPENYSVNLNRVCCVCVYAVCICSVCVCVCVSVCVSVCLSVCVSACVDSYVSCLQIWLSLVVVQLTAPRDGNSIKMSTRARERESERQ